MPQLPKTNDSASVLFEVKLLIQRYLRGPTEVKPALDMRRYGIVHMDIQKHGLRSLKTVACVLNDPFKVQGMQQYNLLSALASDIPRK